MSTFTAVGPALGIDGPLPVAPPQSLLNTPDIVVSQDATRVLNGVNVWMYPTGCSELWEPCSDGTFRTKSDESTQLTPRFDAFVVYKTVTCSTIGFDNAALEDLSRRATAVLDATLSGAVEQALAAGVAGSSNPFFSDANMVDVTPTPGTAVSPRVGVSALEEAIGGTCRRGLLHLTPAVVAGLPAPLREGTTLATANGTPIASGMGYQGVEPQETDTTEDWVFATGGVQVHLGPVTMTTPKQSVDRSDNVVTFRAEKYVLAVWDGIDDDTLAAAAVLVDWAA
jgi:hypothetical protein